MRILQGCLSKTRRHTTPTQGPLVSTVLVRIRIIRKLANFLNGVNLSDVRVGDCVDLPAKDARILIAERWAEIVDPHPREVPEDKGKC